MKTLKALTSILVILGLAVSGSAMAEKSKKTKTRKSHGGEDTTSVVSTPTTTTTPTGVYTSGAATLDHPGRLLASNCFQCHGTNGHGMESLAGQSASEISGELYEMKQKPIGANIMHVYAQGFTTDQINLIGDYFSKQQR